MDGAGRSSTPTAPSRTRRQRPSKEGTTRSSKELPPSASSSDTKPEERKHSSEGSESSTSTESLSHSDVPKFRLKVEIDEKPRQIVLAAVLLAILIGGGFFAAAEQDKGATIRHGLKATLFVTCFYGMVQFRDTALTRPHPAFWRFLHGAGVWYLLLLSFLLMLQGHTAKTLLFLAFPDCSDRPAQEKEGDTTALGLWHLNCEIPPSLPTMADHMTSIWFIGHIVGWWGKMLILRDYKLCLMYALFFELSELSLQFAIPEFQECWWDSVFMDFSLSNMIGMYSGHLTLKYLNCREYRWTSLKDIRGVKKKTYRMLQQFTPFSWSAYRWFESQTLRNYILTSLVVFGCVILEMNTFFIILSMHLPPTHLLVFIRFFIVMPNCIPAIHEWHQFVVEDSPRLGQSTWTMVVIAILETVVFLKYVVVENSMSLWEHLPLGVIIPWAHFLFLQMLYIAFYYKLERQARLEGKRWKVPRGLMFLGFSSCLPLLGLCRYYAD